MRFRPIPALLPFVMIALGCGASQPRPNDARAARASIAVLPTVWATSDPSLRVDGARAIEHGLGGVRGLSVVDAQRVRRRLGSAPASCPEDVACLRSVGRQLGADWVVVVKLAELGHTVLARTRMVDVLGGTQEQSVQRVVHDATAARVAAVLSAMANDLGAPLVPRPPTAWYAHPWLWVAGGAVLVGAAVVVAVLAIRGGQTPPDAIVTPP